MDTHVTAMTRPTWLEVAGDVPSDLLVDKQEVKGEVLFSSTAGRILSRDCQLSER